jgi:hypothetical protein
MRIKSPNSEHEITAWSTLAHFHFPSGSSTTVVKETSCDSWHFFVAPIFSWLADSEALQFYELQKRIRQCRFFVYITKSYKYYEEIKYSLDVKKTEAGACLFCFPSMRAVWKVRGLALLLRVRTLWKCGDGLFFEVPPLASDVFLTTLQPLLENVLQTVHHFEISCLGAPFSWLENSRNRMRRDVDCMADVLMGFHRSTFSKPNTEFSTDLAPMRFLSFYNHEKGAPILQKSEYNVISLWISCLIFHCALVRQRIGAQWKRWIKSASAIPMGKATWHRTSALDGSGQLHAPAALSPGKERLVPIG